MHKEDKGSICKLSFSIREKIFAQFTFVAGVMAASYGLFLENTFLGVGYLLYSGIGIFLLMRYTICPRCPHLHIANDCVNLPASIVKKIVSKRTGPLNISEKTLFIVVLYGIFILPIYWLCSTPVILTVFVILYGSHLLSLHTYFCPKCENNSCIQYRNKNSI